MPNPTALAALLILAGALFVSPAGAAGRDTALAGSGLSIDTPCARHVDIQPDPALHGQVAISATADHQEELDRLVFETHGQVRILTVPKGCWRPALDFAFSPTLDITVRVPAGAAVTVDESGAGNYTIGAVGGPLSLDISGAAKVAAEQAATLTVTLSGNATVTVAKAAGVTDLDLSGHGKVAIGEAAISSLSVDLSGAGSISVTNGHIGRVTLDESGFGNIRIGAEVGDAKVDLSGAGSVRFAKVTGSLEKDVSGAGTVSIGE